MSTSDDWVLWNQGGGPAPPVVFPTAPPRMEVLRARIGFQGIVGHSTEFGDFRAWGPELGSLNDHDADAYVRQVLAEIDDLGQAFSAVEFAVSWNYWTPWFQIPGKDRAYDLPELRRRVKQAIVVGAPLGLKAVYLFCAGDGESVNENPSQGQYNDPFGHTYGRQWFLHNFERIHAAFGPQPDDPTDLRDWMVFGASYDGGDAYQWVSGENAAKVWRELYRVVHQGGVRKGYVFFEWPAGQIQLGDDFPTYTPENGGCIDLWLLEDPIGWYPPTEDDPIRAITQQAGRAVRPYNRPAWAVDDPHPPLLIPSRNRHGEQTVVQFYEHTTYSWVHGGSKAEVDNNRRVLRSIAPQTLIC